MVQVTPTDIPFKETFEGYGGNPRKVIWNEAGEVIQQECQACRKMLPASAFTRSRNVATGIYAECKKCAAARGREAYRRDPIPIVVRAIASRSKKNGIFCDLTLNDVQDIYNEQEGRCFYTGLEFGDIGTNYAISVDRIVPDRGYTRDNIVLCHRWVNVMKLDHPVGEFFSKILVVGSNIDRLISQKRLVPYLEGVQFDQTIAPLQEPLMDEERSRLNKEIRTLRSALKTIEIDRDKGSRRRLGCRGRSRSPCVRVFDA